MLEFVRKHSRSWIIKALLLLIAVVFTAWGGYSYNSRHETEIAKVGEHYITIAEHNNAISNMTEAYRRQFGGAFSDDLLRKLNIRQQALEALIEHYLVIKGASELGLTATTEEVQRRILEIPVFQDQGKFDMKRYEGFLRNQGMKPEQFEQEMAQQITSMKVQNFIRGRAVVTEDEIQLEHHFNNDQVKVAYILIDPKSLEGQVAVDDSALQEFHKKNQNRYMEPEKRQIAYVLLNTDDLAKDSAVSDTEIKAYYEDNLRQYEHEKEVRAQHILFKLKPDATPEEVEKVRAEAQKVQEEAKKDKDFSELARKYSQDEGSASKGGELGFFTAKKMQPSFSAAAFAMNPGDISDLVRTPFGFHIIKVEEVRPERTAPLEEVKGDIEKSLKYQKAKDVAYAKVRDLRDLSYARKDIGKAAQELKLQVTGPEWIQQAADQPDSGPFPPQVKAKIFELGQDDISDIIETPKGMAVAQLKSIQKPQPIPFEKVKDKVTNDYRAEQSEVLAQKKAAEILAQAKEKGSLAEVAKAQNLNLRQSESFSRQNPDKDLKLLQGDSLNKVFDLQESKPFPEAPLELGNRYVVCQLQGRTPAAQPTAEESATISAQLLRQKQAGLWEAWLSDMRKKTKIEFYKEI